MRDYKIFPISEVINTKTLYNCDYLISLLDSNPLDVSVPKDVISGKFFFDDIEEPEEGLVMPSIDNIANIIQFVNDTPIDAHIGIHCTAGCCRSPAIGIILNAWQMGLGFEEEAIEKTCKEAIYGKFSIFPNKLIIKLGDTFLERNGAIINAYEKWEKAMKENPFRDS